ncbi:50S ribosomal protein L29 [Hymenobacter sp. BT186]|uniref:Large ribosomal subunit protein uL29 n=1 Tax=Hymenobacter telluris TaxID=2816474 RepID=A0A939EVB2_9BACT|nr:50S ribosomal protein L29 [Hymenobacter telluris]MBO0357157.1 50S ribosomal protein L29 [Hymenobacter telluris]MBW3373184.1 50S ribosomal protein L29 [Hymenobacter norwichensis]
MKNTEILALSDEALNEQIKTEKANGQSLRFAHAISPLENPGRLKTSRKNVARLLTEQTRRKNEQANKTAN